MTKQAINTEMVTSYANKLRTTNNNINNAFDELQRKAKQLETNWKSSAGTTAQTSMYQLFNYRYTRSAVLQNYINMLEQQINPGYTRTETVNTTLADKFK